MITVRAKRFTDSSCYFSFHSKRHRHEPVLLEGVEGSSPSQWSQIALGNYHSVGVTPKGEVFTWGHGGNGSLGHGTTNDTIMKPAHVKSLVGKTVTHVCCSDHTVVVTTEGELFTW